MIALLSNTQPRLFHPELAAAFGLNEAIVLQQLHYWLQRSTKIIDGRKWAYNTYQQWQEVDFPWWSIPTIRRTFARLEELGLVQSEEHNKMRTDRTKWYTIDYEKLEGLVETSDQNDPVDLIKMISPSDQNDPLEQIKMISSVPKRSTLEITNKREEDLPTTILMELYQMHCPNLPQIKTLTEQRKKRLAGAWEIWQTIASAADYFRIVGESQFLNGRNQRGWKATFDWLLLPDNIAKVLEGAYKIANPSGPWIEKGYEYPERERNLAAFRFLYDDDERD